MKSRNEKTKKKHETTIGKIIYGFLLFMPLLAIGVTCGYVMFNKNAYQSFDSEQNVKLQKINNYQSMIVNETYTITQFSRTTQVGTAQSPIISFNGVDTYLQQFNVNHNLTYVAVSFTLAQTGNVFINGYTELNSTSRASEFHSGDVVFLNRNLPVNFTITNIYAPSGYQDISGLTIYRNYIETGNLSNVFYYSIDKVEQSPLFNWSKNSLIYTGMSNTAQALDITNTFIPMLLTYWLIISVFYYLYDIILIILHVFHRKIHELEESI